MVVALTIILRSLFAIALGYGQTMPYQLSNENQVKKNEMEVSWEDFGPAYRFHVSAPTSGWIALGINPEDELVGSSLYMARIQDGKVQVIDHYVRGFADYLPVIELGGQSLVSDTDGKWDGTRSVFSFCIPANSDSQFHHDLKEGQTYTFHLAFSESKDFQHHSVMRTKVVVRL